MKSRFLPLLAITAFFLGLLLVAPGKVSAVTEAEIVAKMAKVNENLAARGKDFLLAEVEYYTAKDEVGKIVYFFDHTLQAGAQFVPYDPRRYGVAEIYWLSDQIDGTANGPSSVQTQTAVDHAMATWNTVTCSNIPLVKLPDAGRDLGVVQYIYGFGGYLFPSADITHAGWLPGDFFDAALAPGASDVVLGATFTFVFFDGSGNPTDIDNNGKMDIAFTETYYNNKFQWGINTSIPYDVESIVLHETGHALGLGHFGTLFLTDPNGKFHFAPRDVMNAGYTGVQQDVKGTGKGAFCSVWGGWPDYN
jgi:hypothetical protein